MPRVPGSKRLKVAAALVVGVAVVGIATWAFAGPAGAHPGMSCNPAPGHGSPGCHVDAATTTTTVAATTTTQASTTTTKRTTTTAKPSTPTTKPSTSTTKPGTSTTGGSTTTSGATSTTSTAAAATTAGATTSTDGAATTTTAAGSTTTESVAAPEATAPSGAESGTGAPATEVISWNCNKCHEGVGPDFAAALPGHIHANPDAVRAVYETKVTFSILAGSILAAGMFIVATSISLRGLARHRRKAALRKKGL